MNECTRVFAVKITALSGVRRTYWFYLRKKTLDEPPALTAKSSCVFVNIVHLYSAVRLCEVCCTMGLTSIANHCNKGRNKKLGRLQNDGAVFN